MKDTLPTNAGPDFICIGAQKAGTTWLYDNLFPHPDLQLLTIKELHFFDSLCPNKEVLGIESPPSIGVKEKLSQLLRQPSVKNLRTVYRFHYQERSIKNYYRLYEFIDVDKKSGDFTPAYSTLDERGVQFAYQVLKPSCKVFIVLRNPIERIWSGLRMQYRGREEKLSELDKSSLLRELEQPSHRLRTDYKKILPLWSQYFFDRFKVFLYDDLVENPALFLKSVQHFLEIRDHVDVGMIQKMSNASSKKMTMPTELKQQLEKKYSSDIAMLENWYSGIHDKWTKPSI